MPHDNHDPIRAGVRAASPIGRSRVDTSLHRLQWNESPFPFPADLKEEVLARLLQAEWERYPAAMRPFALIDRLAAHLGIDAARLVVSAGSGDLIRIVLSTLLRPGAVLVEPTPTFILYRRQAAISGARVVGVPCSAADDWALPVEALLQAAAAEQAGLIALCAPNNPTGTVHSPARVAELVAGAAALGATVVVDEAYLHFNPFDLLPLALQHDNVILLRTFSKAYSMAGVRVGYAVAHPAIAAELQKVVTSFPLNLFGEVTAGVALDHHDRFMAQVAEVVAERERLAAALAALPGVHVFASGTNFLLVQLDAPARPVFDHLLSAHRVLVSDNGGYPDLPNHLRISIGTPAQNSIVIQGLTEALA